MQLQTIQQQVETNQSFQGLFNMGLSFDNFQVCEFNDSSNKYDLIKNGDDGLMIFIKDNQVQSVSTNPDHEILKNYRLEFVNKFLSERGY